MAGIGPMRQQLTLRAPAVVTDSVGGWPKNWTDQATVPGNLQPLTGSRLVEANVVRGQTSHRATIRYYEGLLTSWSVVDADTGDAYRITGAINPDGRKRFHQLDLQFMEGQQP